jgi:NADPH:quinone reductase-like Zn-dependent oxidoreductase
VAVEARNLAPLPGDVDFTIGASPPISGLTAWQGVVRTRPPSGRLYDPAEEQTYEHQPTQEILRFQVLAQ